MLPPSDAQQQVIAHLAAQKAQQPPPAQPSPSQIQAQIPIPPQHPDPELILQQIQGSWSPVTAGGPQAPNADAFADAGTQADWQAFTKQHAAHLPSYASNLSELLQMQPLQGYQGEQPLLPTATYGPGSSDPVQGAEPPDAQQAMLDSLFNAYMTSRGSTAKGVDGTQTPWDQQNQQQFGYAPSPPQPSTKTPGELMFGSRV